MSVQSVSECRWCCLHRLRLPMPVSQLLWRNWLARSAVNRKVGGSSPPRSVFLPLLRLLDFRSSFCRAIIFVCIFFKDSNHCHWVDQGWISSVFNRDAFPIDSRVVPRFHASKSAFRSLPSENSTRRKTFLINSSYDFLLFWGDLKSIESKCFTN